MKHALASVDKTKLAIDIINLLVKKNQDILVLIVVPTEVLKDQWFEKLVENNLLSNCKIEIINSAIKTPQVVDLLIIDEIHGVPSEHFIKIFKVIKYKLLLGLTGTLERLDGREALIKKYASVCDKVTIEEAEKNG